ncbi:hypothetical protein [Seonamhaeicola sp.]|uniref:hypothetical protein n=1 Tax=Seonamhaeicola sp. TaxID=1912245 RepID=UPI0035616A74
MKEKLLKAITENEFMYGRVKGIMLSIEDINEGIGYEFQGIKVVYLFELKKGDFHFKL